MPQPHSERTLKGDTEGVKHIQHPERRHQQRPHPERRATPRYRSRTGQPLTMIQWLARRQQTPYRTIGHDVCGRWLLITEWVGTEPLYETALFGPELAAVGRWPWTTERDAQSGHARMLALLVHYGTAPRDILLAALETANAPHV